MYDRLQSELFEFEADFCGGQCLEELCGIYRGKDSDIPCGAELMSAFLKELSSD